MNNDLELPIIEKLTVYRFNIFVMAGLVLQTN